MRDEILKRLDDFVGEMVAEVEGEWGPYDDPDNDNWVRRKWLALRTTLAAERCENCMYWGDDHRCLCATVQHQLGRLGRGMPFTSAVFCCMYFWAKKDAPP